MTVYDATHTFEIEDTIVEIGGDEYEADYVEVYSEQTWVHTVDTAVQRLNEWYGEIEWAAGVDFEAPRRDDGFPLIQEMRIKVDEKKDLVLGETLFESDTEFIATK